MAEQYNQALIKETDVWTDWESQKCVTSPPVLIMCTSMTKLQIYPSTRVKYFYFFVVIENRRFKSYVKFTHAVLFRIISLAYMTKLGLKLFKITKKLWFFGIFAKIWKLLKNFNSGFEILKKLPKFSDFGKYWIFRGF